MRQDDAIIFKQNNCTINLILYNNKNLAQFPMSVLHCQWILSQKFIYQNISSCMRILREWKQVSQLEFIANEIIDLILVFT